MRVRFASACSARPRFNGAGVTSDCGTVRVGDWRIYGRHFRPGAPPTGSVVLVHGMVVAGTGMLPLARELAGRRLEVHLPDLPGFGWSDKPRRALDVDGLAEALAGWISGCGLEGSSVLGNSFGTQVAAAAVEQMREKTGPLALLSPTIDQRFRRRWTRTLPPGRPGGPPAGGMLGWVQRRASERLVVPDDRSDEVTLRRLVVSEHLAAGPPRALSTYRHALRDDLAGRIPRLRTPVLVLRAENDRLVSRQWAASLARLADAPYAEIPGADHDAQYNLPAAVADAVIAHLVGASSLSGNRVS